MTEEAPDQHRIVVLFDRLKSLFNSDTKLPPKRRDFVVLLLALAEDIYGGYLEESEDHVASLRGLFKAVLEDESQN